MKSPGSGNGISASSSEQTSNTNLALSKLQDLLMDKREKSSSATSTDNGNGDDESFEILDLTGLANRTNLEKTMDRIFGDITKASAGKQVLVGGGAGWLSGLLLVKVGKAAALTLGATALAFQVAQYNGLIKIEWTKVNRMVRQAKSSAKSLINQNAKKKDLMKEVQNFYHENFFLAVGFSGGFLTGLFF